MSGLFNVLNKVTNKIYYLITSDYFLKKLISDDCLVPFLLGDSVLLSLVDKDDISLPSILSSSLLASVDTSSQCFSVTRETKLCYDFH